MMETASEAERQDLPSEGGHVWVLGVRVITHLGITRLDITRTRI